MFAGIFAIPIDLGKWSAYGRAMLARKKLVSIIDSIIEDPNRDPNCLISFLCEDNKFGQVMTQAEVHASVINIVLASKTTTEQSINNLFVDLARHPKWAQKLAEDHTEITSMNQDSLVRRIVLETLRRHPQLPNTNRICPSKDMSLGEHGTIPAGTLITTALGLHMENICKEYNPDQWGDKDYLRENFLAFGEHTPHRCPGQHMAMLILEVFAKELVRWDFQAIDPKQNLDLEKHFDPAYNNLKVKVFPKLQTDSCASTDYNSDSSL
jgi:cytochrome P450